MVSAIGLPVWSPNSQRAESSQYLHTWTAAFRWWMVISVDRSRSGVDHRDSHHLGLGSTRSRAEEAAAIVGQFVVETASPCCGRLVVSAEDPTVGCELGGGVDLLDERGLIDGIPLAAVGQ